MQFFLIFLCLIFKKKIFLRPWSGQNLGLVVLCQCNNKNLGLMGAKNYFSILRIMYISEFACAVHLVKMKNKLPNKVVFNFITSELD